ncbi:hypothetical protein AKJ52_00900 [candidate division MSBL1 archaeon SCGC-AAA382C18]|uniref:Transcription regulator PadR N-terminal domain-containing protein n=1 Tax=candidate division MSBL1 archaeon SCGC-AAA382C18 TaxID=1698281 RepID=A0A133VL23_9EURY|nr:hypothetical protein AKJ52_00900 [candidate division MSBL1 archaeon SCGC-AAA382C18]
MKDVNLLRTLSKKGGTELLHILESDEKIYSEIKEEAELSNGTTQRRLKELSELGLVEAEAKLTAGGKPVKSYNITDRGRKVIETLNEII